MDGIIGKSIQELTTPCLLVESEVMKKNIRTMQEAVDHFGKALRPHIKTHKCVQIARQQLEAGAIGITCATVGEAEAMAKGGIKDILIANQVVTADKLWRIARMLVDSDVKFVVDSLEGTAIANQVALENDCVFEVLLEVDSGAHRCGVQTPEEAVILVGQIMKMAHLKFGGIQAYNGGTSYLPDLLERDLACKKTDGVIRRVVEAVSPITKIPRISGAGTGNSPYMMKYGTMTEIQSGSYVFSDNTYASLAPLYQPALSLLTTVISRPTATRVVCDAGLKSLGTEFTHPYVIGYSNLEQEHFSEEHLQWDAERGTLPSIGEKIRLIPSHSCTTVNLHRQLYVIENEVVIEVWPITAF